MARPKIYEEVTIEDVDMKGHGVAHVDGYTLFIDDAFPGDVVDALVRRRKSGHAICRVIHRHHNGVSRITPFCEHFYDCGGCVWQDISYETQCAMKSRMVEQAFIRYGVIDPAADPRGVNHEVEILPCEQVVDYRNRLDYSFSSQRWKSRDEVSDAGEIENRGALGFHAPKRFDKVVEIHTCHLQGEPTNRIRNAVAEFTAERNYPYYNAVENTGLLRNLVVRTSLTGDVMVLLVLGEDNEDALNDITGFLQNSFPEITSCYSMINTSKNDDIGKHEVSLVFGKPDIAERCGHVALQIHPKSFYQTNPGQAEHLFALVNDWAELSGKEHVLDLYCGIGSIGLYLSSQCARVTGLEIVPEAIERARENAANNGIENAEFLVGAAEETLPEWGERGDVPDIIIADPPRVGLHKKVLEALIAIKAPRIIYVSCNPRTQAENIGVLLDQYELRRYQPVDMFPHTRHVENVAELTLRQ